MHVKSSMKLLLFISTCFIVHGQLSIDELTFFVSKYTSTGNCSDFRYEFPHFRVNYHHFNQLLFDCPSSSIIFRNTERESSSFCPNDEDYLENFRIHFFHVSFATIHVNQFPLHGIELSSIDDFIQNTYLEYSYYRSQWALLIHLETSDKQQSHYLAVATNDEMTFILFVTPLSSNPKLVELILPYENRFHFNHSHVNVWRIDPGFVYFPKSLEKTISYRLSKSEFRLFDNETFYLYGTETLVPRRLAVYIDQTQLTCTFDRVLQCTFPILPPEIHDSHQPFLNMTYSRYMIFNATLRLNPRIRLNQIPIKHPVTNISSYKIDLDPTLCRNHSYRSQFSLIIHLFTKDMNGTEKYIHTVNDDMALVNCNGTAEIGHKIEKLINSVPIRSFTSLMVDVTHQWFEQPNCRSESTRITFN